MPSARAVTRPASRSSRRWRETAGRLMGSASASSCTERSPSACSISTIARRWGSPRASKGSPARSRIRDTAVTVAEALPTGGRRCRRTTRAGSRRGRSAAPARPPRADDERGGHEQHGDERDTRRAVAGAGDGLRERVADDGEGAVQATALRMLNGSSRRSAMPELPATNGSVARRNPVKRPRTTALPP